ncbi:hypothetical protein Lal_00029628 [Lupinus albus]|uniref:Putative vinorine synthase n=1 Tax=Lupinus albus TaxID=3870 RepID=A0A6A5MZI3_LUPAL|nr:putative vinorine synthase [Lupinus albus]KAF1876282.1 hypothetical protein Lal_00029628 [Lupinus albus]
MQAQLKEGHSMEMESISRETIKPSSPTPSHLIVYPLSLIDNIVPPNSVPLIYFYPNQPQEYDTNDASTQEYFKISTIKKSLSKVLSIYYPLAGRLKDKSIECNDQGVSLFVTRIKSNLSKILQNPSKVLMNPLFPDEFAWKDMGPCASLLAIQINIFACGGIAIGLCMSHKVADVSTLFNFVNDWATLNKISSEGQFIFPIYVVDAGASVFPQGNLAVLPGFKFVKQNNTVTRRFVFEGSKIESLKAMVVSSSSQKVTNPTRIQVVIALLYKCVVSALISIPKNAPFRVSTNLRKRMVPPLPEKSIGNFVWSFYPSNQSMHNKEPQLHELVTNIREGLYEFCDKNVKNFGDVSFVYEFLKKAPSLPQKKEAILDMEKKTMFLFTSWCRYPMYEVDFGWGKPIWVTTSDCPMKNTIVLMDTRDGKGIEALVNLEDKDMAMFECDVELLHYASLSPN